MSTAVALRNQPGLDEQSPAPRRQRREVAIRQEQDFTAEQITLLKSTVCKGASDMELALFREVCKAKRLDPFSRQIHAVKRPCKDERGNWSETMTFQTGIDGYRLIAERTGKYAGQDDPMWCGEDGVWKEVWLSQKPPVAARAAVYRSDFVKPLVRVARYSAYVQTRKQGNEAVPNSMWSKMGPEQLHKCAEALALRAAFPEELSGLYTVEEMGQASNGDHENGSREAQKAVAEQIIERQQHAKQLREADLHVSEADLAPVLEASIEDVKEKNAAKRKAGKVDFDVLKNFRKLKADLKKLSGSDDRYYAVLAEFGVDHSDAFRDLDHARDTYRGLQAALKDYEAIAGLREAVKNAMTGKWSDVFWKVAGGAGYDETAIKNAKPDDLVKLLRMVEVEIEAQSEELPV